MSSEGVWGMSEFVFQHVAHTDPAVAELLSCQQYGSTFLAWHTPRSRKGLLERGGKVDSRVGVISLGFIGQGIHFAIC